MSLTTPSSVEELLNYRLARLVAATSAPGVRLLEGRFGVTRRQWGLLGILAEYGPVSPGDLSRRAHLEPSKVSLHIADLVARDLIYREPIPGDRRRALLKLTEVGRELFESAYPLLADLSRTMLDALTTEEVQALDTIMRKLSDAADHLSAQQPVPERADRRRGGTRRSRGQKLPANQ
jgi:DNA-binding MarR family transcriptional regulator